jgi:hypothetical protein
MVGTFGTASVASGADPPATGSGSTLTVGAGFPATGITVNGFGCASVRFVTCGVVDVVAVTLGTATTTGAGGAGGGRVLSASVR